jgi:hypothetical protein
LWEIAEYRRSKIWVSDICTLLEVFLRLETLQIFGRFAGDCGSDGYTLQCAGLRHDHLKSLIIETAHITQVNIEQLCSMNLPALDYLELWFGQKKYYRSAMELLIPILAGYTYPKLKYLGLCSSEEVGTLVREIINAPIMEHLAVLDLKMGTLSDIDIDPLLDAEATANLKVLNVTGNYLSNEAIARLSQRSYRVISNFQTSYEGGDDEEQETYEERQLHRRYALYE